MSCCRNVGMVRCVSCYFSSECSYENDKRVVTCFQPDNKMQKFNADVRRECDVYRDSEEA